MSKFAILTIICSTYLSCTQAQNTSLRSVSALGRLEPEGGVIRISAPPTSRAISGSLLSELHVKPGDFVKQGDLLAVTHTNQLMQVAIKQAEAKLNHARLSAEAKRNEVKEACIIAEYASRESKRRNDLLLRKLTSEEEADQAQTDAAARTAQCAAAEANQLVAEANIPVAKANLELTKVELQHTMIRAPFSGRVLDVLIQPGEFIGSKGILELARVDRMYAVAEVFETDIGHIRLGQRASISSPVLKTDLTGQVQFIHLKVAKQDEQDTDPAARKDARIIEVEVLLDNPEAAAKLTYHQVKVIFKRQGGP